MTNLLLENKSSLTPAATGQAAESPSSVAAQPADKSGTGEDEPPTSSDTLLVESGQQSDDPTGDVVAGPDLTLSANEASAPPADNASEADSSPTGPPGANGQPSGATAAAALTGADLFHAAYQALLDQLPLEPGQRDDLRWRRLDDAEIDRRGYRTLRNAGRGQAASAVHQQLGDTVLGVPGFVKGDKGVTLNAEWEGLLVPVRDTQGRVTALKIFCEGGSKCVLLAGCEGVHLQGSLVHVPLGLPTPTDVVRVTQGELKADICFALDGTPTIGLPNVAYWRASLEVLKALRARTVVLAFDAVEVRNKLPAFEQAQGFWQALLEGKFEVEMEVWDEQ